MSKRLFLILTLLLCFTLVLVACNDTPDDPANDPSHVHTEEVVAAKAATCTETGLTEGKKCSVCNTVIVKQNVVPVVSHDFQWVVDTQSTLTVNGVRHEECSFCGLKQNEGASIPKLTHEHNYENALCTVCGEAGGYITFGTYEQDNDLTNGAEAIEWLVLDVQDGKALVISRYVLDYQLYHKKWENFTWQSCSSRAWLNETFYNEAFSEAEQARIQVTTVDNRANPLYDATDSSPTNDKVFFLSMQEAEAYFGSSLDRSTSATAYAVDKGASVGSNGNTWWWLRTNGVNPWFSTYVSRYGVIAGHGTSHNGTANLATDAYDCGVRPAMWITLE